LEMASTPAWSTIPRTKELAALSVTVPGSIFALKPLEPLVTIWPVTVVFPVPPRMAVVSAVGTTSVSTASVSTPKAPLFATVAAVVKLSGAVTVRSAVPPCTATPIWPGPTAVRFRKSPPPIVTAPLPLVKLRLLIVVSAPSVLLRFPAPAAVKKTAVRLAGSAAVSVTPVAVVAQFVLPALFVVQTAL